jgi:hypothetical protein
VNDSSLPNDSIRWQVEIVLQFFTGSLDISEVYCDEFSVVAAKYLSSISGFWFDFVTSLPWSFNDLYAYQVTMSECESVSLFSMLSSFSEAASQHKYKH